MEDLIVVNYDINCQKGDFLVEIALTTNLALKKIQKLGSSN